MPPLPLAKSFEATTRRLFSVVSATSGFAAERAYSQAELARRSARQAAFQRQFDEATHAATPGDDAPR